VIQRRSRSELLPLTLKSSWIPARKGHNRAVNWALDFLRRSTDGQRIQHLRGMSLFKELNARELREVDELLHERNYQKDEIVFDEGDVGLGLFIVVSGRVKVVSSHTPLQQLAPEFCCGDFFGEMSLFDEEPRMARVIATEPALVAALFRTEFFSLLERNRSIGAKILFELSRTVVRRSRLLLLNQQHLPSL
jgi:CRP/FNR family transcriptional regulator, cyclic AMP receptor protein